MLEKLRRYLVYLSILDLCFDLTLVLSCLLKVRENYSFKFSFILRIIIKIDNPRSTFLDLK